MSTNRINYRLHLHKCDDREDFNVDSSESETDFNGGEDDGTTDVVSSLFEEVKSQRIYQ